MASVTSTGKIKAKDRHLVWGKPPQRYYLEVIYKNLDHASLSHARSKLLGQLGWVYKITEGRYQISLKIRELPAGEETKNQYFINLPWEDGMRPYFSTVRPSQVSVTVSGSVLAPAEPEQAYRNTELKDELKCQEIQLTTDHHDLQLKASAYVVFVPRQYTESQTAIINSTNMPIGQSHLVKLAMREILMVNYLPTRLEAILN